MESKYFSFLDSYKKILGQTEGANSNDIEQIEREYDIILPSSYKEYLLRFGRNCGLLMPSYLMTIDNLSRNRSCIEFDLENTIHNNLFKIDRMMFFFAQWQGSVFYFFCDDNEDPPIYFVQDFDNVEKYKNSFSEFVKEEGLYQLLKARNLL